MSTDFTRGRSQIMFKYLPGAIFFNDDRYFKVSHLNMSKVNFNTSRIEHEMKKFISNWTKNNELKVSPFPRNENNYYFGEIQSVEYELFPLVFSCVYCGNVHEYWDLDSLTKQNPTLTCEFCNKKAKIKQFPYVMIHDNGDLKSLRVATNAGAKSFKEKYDGITMNDTRSFRTATWYNRKTNTNLGSLGSKRTDLPIVEGMKPYMGGKHASDGDVFKPAIINIVNLKNDDLISRQANNDFSYIQIGALLELSTISKSHFAQNFKVHESSNLATNLLNALQNEAEKAALLKALGNIGQTHLLEDTSIKDELETKLSNLGLSLDDELVINDRLLHEYLYSIYESEGKSIDDKVQEASDVSDYLQKDILTRAKKKLSLIGIEKANLLEKFPVLTVSPGFTRRSSNRKESILNPYKQKIQNNNRTVVPVMLSENESIIFKLDPLRILAWLNINGLLSLPNSSLEKSDAELYLYITSKIASFEPSELAEFNLANYQTVDNKVISAMIFQLLHTLSHMMLNAGKSVIGLDIDSLAEYIFPSSSAYAIYVSKLQGGGMGNLIAAFENDLERWINTTFEHTQLCLYDPVCKDHKAACHACSYLKFSCQHFNRGVSRALLIGGPLGDKSIVGFFNSNVNEEINRITGGV
ncbi:DUF1998 domain-containing protein [Cytobacillus solani]|nr:DUF1998 domain-containing protein [Cytobacillus solani]